MKKYLLVLFSLAAFTFSFGQVTNCGNFNFEAAATATISSATQIPGWKFSNQNNWSCGYNHDSIQNTFASEVINAANGYIDPNIGSIYPIYSVFGGTVQNAGSSINPAIGAMSGSKFLRLGSPQMTQNQEKIERKFKVDSMNWYQRYAYMFVTIPGMSGVHVCCTHPMFKVIVTDLTTQQVITNKCQFTYLYNPSILYTCNGTPNTADTFYYKGTFSSPLPVNDWPHSISPFYSKWNIRTLNFLQFKGDSIKLEFYAGKCSSCNHFGYAYFDSECAAGGIYANNILNTTGTFSACNNATLSTVPGYTYSWNGPNIASVNAQSIVVNSSGVYSLSIFSNQDLISMQTISVTIFNTVPIQINTSCDTICMNSSCLMTIPQNLNFYNWNTGSTTFSTVVSPTVSTYYYVQAQDINGCTVSSSKVIYVLNCTSLNALNAYESKFLLYPNPANKHVTIEFSSFTNHTKPKEIQLVDVLGREVKTILIESKTQNINIEDLPNGVYYLQLQTPSGLKITKKLLKE